MLIESTKIFSYAKACYELLLDDKKSLNETLSLFEQLSLASKDCKELDVILRDPLISDKEKFEFLLKIFPSINKIDVVNKLVQLLIGKRRLYYLTHLGPIFRAIYDDHMQICELKIISAAPIEEKKLEQIKASLEKSLKSSITLKSVQDESLIAGIILESDEYILDNSLRGKLNKVKNLFASSN
jgi:F-type H+-transporting ATPase subunit delta